MTAIALACTLGGALLIAATLLDIVLTVLHPYAESPFSNRFHRLSWRLLHAITRLSHLQVWGHAILAWALPLMIAGVIGLWMLLLLIGFGLIYYPWLGNPAFFDIPTASAGSFAEALYFSGASLTTVGYGDFQAAHAFFRALAIAEAASGFVVISLSVAYVLAVYPALIRTHALAVALDAEVAGQPGALPLLRRYLTEEGNFTGDLTGLLRELALELLALTEAHQTHPVLYYAHPPRVRHSFVRVLVIAQSLVGLLRYGLSPDHHGRIVRHPQLLLLEQALHYSLRQLTASLHIQAVEQESDEPARRPLVTAYDRLSDELAAIGLTPARTRDSAPVPALQETSADDPARESTLADEPVSLPNGADSRACGERGRDPALDRTAPTPLDAYLTFRVETDPHIAAYAATCGYPLDEARSAREVTR